MSILLLVLGLVLFVSLVVVHEYGHFLAARRNGVEVEEFGIGFPPKAWGKKLKSGLLFSINWLPIGGFVRLKGENDSDKRPGSFGAAGLKAKTEIMLAGVAMNLLAAFVLFTLVAWVGMPKLIDNQFTLARDAKVVQRRLYVGGIEKDSPAEKVGLASQDQIEAVAEAGSPFVTTTTVQDLHDATTKFAGKNILLVLKDGSTTRQVGVTLRSKQEVEQYNAAHHCSDESYNGADKSCMGYLGVSPTEYSLERSTWSAPIVALGLMKQLTILTLQGLWHALSALATGHAAQASSQVAGPVGIFAILRDDSILGYQFILFIIAVISLTLAIMNVLPIPALDGGRLFVTWLFHLIRRPLDKRTEELIHGTGFALLMVLFVLITIVDVRRFF